MHDRIRVRASEEEAHPVACKVSQNSSSSLTVISRACPILLFRLVKEGITKLFEFFKAYSHSVYVFNGDLASYASLSLDNDDSFRKIREVS